MTESIYNLVPVEYKETSKPPMYRSTHDPNANLTGSTFGCFGSSRLPGAGIIKRKDGALFGPPDGKILTVSKSSATTTKTTESITKKQQSTGEFHYSDRRKNPTPTIEDKPIVGIRSTKNFIVSNAVEAILKVPKRNESNDLDYLKKEDYGKPPAYLSQVKSEIEREKELIEKYIKEKMGGSDEVPEQLEEMSEQDRQELVFALKKKWEVVNAKFQRICHHVIMDTEGQIRRKEKLEKELQQLESDIDRLERNGPVVIRK